jgi:hypothetical protein
MPDEITPDASAVALATITEQIRGLVEGMARSERQLEKLDPINTALGEMRVSLALKADTSALNMVDQKVINWIAQARGAFVVASLCIGAVQTALIGGGAYIVTHLQSHETSIAVIGARLDSIDRSLKQSQQQQQGKTKWVISCAPSLLSSALKRD